VKEVKITRKWSTRGNFPGKNLVALSDLEIAQTKNLQMHKKTPSC